MRWGLPLIDNLAGVGLQLARQDVHQRAFARAVFAHHRVDLARIDIEADAVQRQHAGKAPGDADKLNDRRLIERHQSFRLQNMTNLCVPARAGPLAVPAPTCQLTSSTGRCCCVYSLRTGVDRLNGLAVDDVEEQFGGHLALALGGLADGGLDVAVFDELQGGGQEGRSRRP